MNSSEKELINILKTSIRNNKYSSNKLSWNSLYNESFAHQISPIVYHYLSKDTLQKMDKSLLNRWKKEVFIMNVVQKKHITKIAHIVYELQKIGVEVIVLKGIVMRNLYSVSELRTMSDGDILIHKKDFKKVRSYLESIGYECGPDDNKIHRTFTCDNELEIEVHWNLINDNYFNGYISDLEDDIWKRADDIIIQGVTTKTLCLDDLILHLCFHMVVHVKYSGFGLRQLYDLSLLIDRRYDEINWDSFIDSIKRYKVYKFVSGILLLTNKLFCIKIPEKERLCKVTDKELELLLDNILISGAHGKKEERKDFRTLYDRELDYPNEISRIYNFVFPKINRLKKRYPELNGRSMLLPLFWIRYILGIIKRNGLVSTIIYSYKSVKLFKLRNMLTQTYEL